MVVYLNEIYWNYLLLLNSQEEWALYTIRLQGWNLEQHDVLDYWISIELAFEQEVI